MAKRPQTRSVPPFCTCEGPFGCVVHDANLDGLTSIEALPPALVLRVVVAANALTARRQQCDGEVYAVPVGFADELEDALRELARARRAKS